MPPAGDLIKTSVRKDDWKIVWPKPLKNMKNRADINNAGGSGSTNTRGTVVPEMHGCSYKTFMNGKPHSFKGTEGVVGLKRWFKKMEQVFEICKCAEDDKVKFAMCTFEGRDITVRRLKSTFRGFLNRINRQPFNFEEKKEQNPKGNITSSKEEKRLRPCMRQKSTWLVNWSEAISSVKAARISVKQ
ncbi:hypothetical protein Tco_1123830 [Tanacetum coccineum]|uniref:Reverse transcriptase domain-containing protein n=1 Tax=Tanacetum coccineum TaxID=301880 RepID=A0ABQ5J654_9ASTR